MSALTLEDILKEMPDCSEEEANEALHGLVDKGLLTFDIDRKGTVKFKPTKEGMRVHKLLTDRNIN